MTTENVPPVAPQAPPTSLSATEPALLYGGGATATSGIIDAIVGLGIPLSDTWKIIIILVVSIGGPFLGVLLTRAKVSPTVLSALTKDMDTVLEDIEAAHGVGHPEVIQPPPDAPKPPAI